MLVCSRKKNNMSAITEFREYLKSQVDYRQPVIAIEAIDYSIIESELSQLGLEYHIWNPAWGYRCCYNLTLEKAEHDATPLDKLRILIKESIKSRLPFIIVIEDISSLLDKNNNSNSAYLAFFSLLKNFVLMYRKCAPNKRNMIILVDSFFNFPPDAAKLFCKIPFPLPDAEDIKVEIEDYKARFNDRFFKSSMLQAQLIASLQGMRLFEIRELFESASFATNNRIDSGKIKSFAKQKEQIVASSGLLEIIDAKIGGSQYLGEEELLAYLKSQLIGMEELLAYLKMKKAVMTDVEFCKAHNLPPCKGFLLVGSPGCGKTMAAKMTACFLQLPLIRFDMGRLMGMYVGQSERNLADALSVVEAAQPCVLWIDEIEKAFAGSGNIGGSDITVRRMVGSFLTWMQEREGNIFIAATANNIESLPPELLRKGRLDEIFYLTYPDSVERKKLFELSLQKYCCTGKDMEKQILEFSLDKNSEFLSGAEIDACVKESCEKMLQSDKSITQLIGDYLKEHPLSNEEKNRRKANRDKLRKALEYRPVSESEINCRN